jgi:hypothetical protein
MNQPESQQPRARAISGKLIILGILAVALVAAGTSWVFRYYATHRAARFWERETAVLIRDAPKVTLFKMPSPELIRYAQDDALRASLEDSAYDISKARGLVHLRNALLDDRSYNWLPESEQLWAVPDDHHWMLCFHDRDSHKTAVILFSKDCRFATHSVPRFLGREAKRASTAPISRGLVEVFTEMSTVKSAEAAATQ